jgi:transcriptional regulator with XRE-family HTH domain
MSFSDWIRDEIKRRGWSQAILAERAGLSRSSISGMLTSGRRKPGMKFFAGIAKAFDLPLAEVVIMWGTLAEGITGNASGRDGADLEQVGGEQRITSKANFDSHNTG